MRRSIFDWGLARWVAAYLVVATSCTSFEKSDTEPGATTPHVNGAGGRGGTIAGNGGGPVPLLTGGAPNGGLGGQGGNLCGNLYRDPGEACDTLDFGIETCASLTSNARPEGIPTCSQDCSRVDTNACFAQSGAGGVGGSFGMGGMGGTFGFEGGSACLQRGADCSTGTCCANLACFGNCCGALLTFCTADSDCCPFNVCRRNGCRLGNGLECQSDQQCGSGTCISNECVEIVEAGVPDASGP